MRQEVSESWSGAVAAAAAATASRLLPALTILVAMAGCIIHQPPAEDGPGVCIDVPRPGYPPPLPPKKPRYRILTQSREGGNDFAYRFSLLLTGEMVTGKRDLETIDAVKDDFRNTILKDYQKSFAVKNVDSLHVDFPEFDKKENGQVEGRAIVISATPVALMDYDANTRTGKLTVRFHTAVGTKEAREWARRNIEALVRDKNIVLTTGTRPPEGRYITLSETWRANTLEIEFKSE